MLVADSAAFRMRHGDGVRILGEFEDGKLNDDGEEIALLDAAGDEMWRFTYNDAGAWPDSPDGGGPALVLIDPDNPPPAAVADRVVQRKDDTEEACVARLAKYHSETAPIVPFYEDAGILRRVDGVGSPDEVTARIRGALGR